MEVLVTVFLCLVVSILWGATNPFIKESTKDIAEVQSTNIVNKFTSEINYLIRNWRYVLLFLINQSGSVLYFVALQNANLSLVVPVANALTFTVTGVVGIFLGEEKPDTRTVAGIGLVLFGITLCVLDSISLGLPTK